MSAPIEFAPRTYLVDLEYLGRQEYIASAFLETHGGIVIVDPGPAVTLPALHAALGSRDWSVDDVSALLLTHIHLDHAGAAGSLVRARSEIDVYVHERGAPHLEHPQRLLESARRIYGERMDDLWGEFMPVPRGNLHVLEGGETLDLGGRRIDVAYTPGHAWHHVSYHDRDSGTAFVGDTAGERMMGTPIIPSTPPPDIELDSWRESVARIRRWDPERLFLTHFGPVGDVNAYLDDHDATLAIWAAKVRRTLEEPGTDEERARRFADDELASLREECLPGAQDKLHYDSIRDDWYGLARYWRKYGSVTT